MHEKKSRADYIEASVSVRYAETDQMGIVYYANYLVWFEVGRVAWCREKGFRYAEMEAKEKRLMVVAEAGCRYKSPARFGEEILVRTFLTKATDRVIRYGYEIRDRDSGKLLATGHTAHIVTDPEFHPARLPDGYRKYFSLPAKRREGTEKG